MGERGSSPHGHPCSEPPAATSGTGACLPKQPLLLLETHRGISMTGIVIQREGPRFKTNPRRSQGNVIGSSRQLSVSSDRHASLGMQRGWRGKGRGGRSLFFSSKPLAAFVPWLLLGTTVCLDGRAPVTMETRPKRFGYERAGSLVAIGAVSLTFMVCATIYSYHRSKCVVCNLHRWPSVKFSFV